MSSRNDRTTFKGQFGVFMVNHIIASGKFTYVCNVIDMMNGEEYAAKVVNNWLEYERAFHNEWNILEKLNHKNILKFIKAYDCYISDMWIVTELCICELETFINIFELDQDLYCFIMGCISSGLAYLHGENIAHRNIQYKNVLLRKSDNMFVIADMGVSKMVEPKSGMVSLKTMENPEGHIVMKTIVGPLHFIAPEIAGIWIGKYKSYNEIADIWMLGMIGFYTVTEDERKNQTAIVDELVHNSSNISISIRNMSCIELNEDIRHFTNRMLNPKPENRPNAAQCWQFFSDYIPKTVYKEMNSLAAQVCAKTSEWGNESRSYLPKKMQAFNSKSMKAARKKAARMQCPENNPPVKNSSLNRTGVSEVVENSPIDHAKNIKSNLNGNISGNLNRKSGSTNLIVESEINKRPIPIFHDQNASGIDADVCRLRGAGKYVGVVGKSETIVVYADNMVAVLDQNNKKELLRMQEEPIKAVLPLKFNAIEFGFICLRETGELYHICTERTNNLNGDSFRVGDKTRIIDGIDPSYSVIGLKYCNGADILIAYNQKSVYAIETTDRMHPNVKLLFDTKADLSISEKISDCNCTLRRTSSGDIYEILVICIDHKNVMRVYQCSLATAMRNKSFRECIVPDNKLKNPINEALYIQQQKIFPDLPQNDYIFVSIGNQILTYSVEALNHKTISYGHKMESLKLDPDLHFNILKKLDHSGIIINGYLSGKDTSLLDRFKHIFKTYRLISIGSHGKIMRMIFIDDSTESGKITHLLSIERND